MVFCEAGDGGEEVGVEIVSDGDGREVSILDLLRRVVDVERGGCVLWGRLVGWCTGEVREEALGVPILGDDVGDLEENVDFGVNADAWEAVSEEKVEVGAGFSCATDSSSEDDCRRCGCEVEFGW